MDSGSDDAKSIADLLRERLDTPKGGVKKPGSSAAPAKLTPARKTPPAPPPARPAAPAPAPTATPAAGAPAPRPTGAAPTPRPASRNNPRPAPKPKPNVQQAKPLAPKRGLFGRRKPVEPPPPPPRPASTEPAGPEAEDRVFAIAAPDTPILDLPILDALAARTPVRSRARDEGDGVTSIDDLLAGRASAAPAAPAAEAEPEAEIEPEPEPAPRTMVEEVAAAEPFVMPSAPDASVVAEALQAQRAKQRPPGDPASAVEAALAAPAAAAASEQEPAEPEDELEEELDGVEDDSAPDEPAADEVSAEAAASELAAAEVADGAAAAEPEASAASDAGTPAPEASVAAAVEAVASAESAMVADTIESVTLDVKPAKAKQKPPVKASPAPAASLDPETSALVAAATAQLPKKKSSSKAPWLLALIGLLIIVLGLSLLLKKDKGEAVSKQLVNANRTSVELVGDSVELSAQFLNSGTGFVRVDSVAVTQGSVTKIALVFDGGDRSGIGTPLTLPGDVSVDGNASFSVIAALRIDSSTCELGKPVAMTVRFTGADGKHRRSELTLPAPIDTIDASSTAKKLCARAPLTAPALPVSTPTATAKASSAAKPSTKPSSAPSATAAQILGLQGSGVTALIEDRLVINGTTTTRSMSGITRLWRTGDGVIAASARSYEAVNNAGRTLWNKPLPLPPSIDPVGRYLLTGSTSGGKGLDVLDVSTGKVLATYRQQTNGTVTGVWRGQSVLVTISSSTGVVFNSWDPATRAIRVVTPSQSVFRGYPAESNLGLPGGSACSVGAGSPPDSISPCAGSLVGRSPDLAHILVSNPATSTTGASYSTAGGPLLRRHQLQAGGSQTLAGAQFVDNNNWVGALRGSTSTRLFLCPLSGDCKQLKLEGTPVAIVLAVPYGA